MVMSPDVLQLCNGVAERFGLVARNFAETLPQIQEEVAANALDEYHAGELQGRLHARGVGIAQLNAEVAELLPTRPLEAAFRGLRTFTFMIRAHTNYAPDIFRGYTPVHPSPNWARYLHVSEFARYGYLEEPMITFALEADEIEHLRFARTPLLYLAAAHRGRLPGDFGSQSPLPILN